MKKSATTATIRKIWDILTPPQRWSAARLAVLMTFGMLLEMLGIGLVLPALAVLSGAQTAAQSASVSRIRALLHNPDDTTLVVIGLFTLLAVYAVKSVFLVVFAWKQARFVTGLQSTTATRLLSFYMHQPWMFHLQRNSATLIHKVTVDNAHMGLLVTSLLTFLTEMLVAIGVGGLMLYVEPAGVVVAGLVLGAATYLFQRVSRQRMDSWGAINYKHDKLRSKHLTESLAGAKDVKILGREAYFIEQHRHDDVVSANMRCRLTTVQQLPRLWYELLAVAGLAFLGTVLVSQGIKGPRLMSRLGLFAAAAFRLLPAANRMMNIWQGSRFFSESIDSLHRELAEAAVKEPAAGPAIKFADLVELVDVSLRYPGATGKALDRVSLRLRKGRALGIIGGSGAGKSTLVDVLLGLLEPDSGAVLVDGTDIRTNIRSWQGHIGYVPQSIYLTDDTVAANVAFGVSPNEIDEDAVRRALRAAQLDALMATLPDGIDTFVGERGVRLSGGQRQRIGIARALYRDPPILVLDEATSSLDTETEKGVMEAVNELHGVKTLVIVAHRLSTVANCDELIRLEHGRVVSEGSFAEVTAPAGPSA